MKSKVLQTALILLISAVTFVAGMYIGASKTVNFYLNMDVSSSATDVKSKIKTLEALKRGEIKEAEESLERLVDVHLGHLGVSYNNSLLKNKEEVLDAIRIAKDYRDRYPGHKVNPTLNNSIVGAFSLIGK